MLPLNGIKVIELTTWAFGPACGAALGDWGADVIKIEHPETGDTFRWFLMALGIDEKEIPVSLFGLNNRNKKGMAIDLKKFEGRKIVYRLIETADIFLSNIPSASLQKLELDYPTLSKINPKIVYALASGFGEKGPDAGKPGFDSTAYWARSGIMSVLSTGDNPPVSQQIPGVGDQISGLVLFGGILLGLLNREKTGESQQIDLSLLGVGTWVTSCALQFFLSTGMEPARFPRSMGANPLANYYKTKDNKWLVIMCLPDEPYWIPLCDALGLQNIKEDVRFRSRNKRLENNVELISIIDAVMVSRTRKEWGSILDKNGIIWSPIATNFEEVCTDNQVLENKFIVDVEHPVFGKAQIVNTPIQLNKKAPDVRALAPEIGQHTEEILLGMNYSWEEIENLKNNKIIP